MLLHGRKCIAVVEVQKSSIQRFESYLRVRSHSQNGESWDGEKRVVRHSESYEVEVRMFEKVQKYRDEGELVFLLLSVSSVGIGSPLYSTSR